MLFERLDLIKEERLLLQITILSLVVAVIVLIPGFFVAPFSFQFPSEMEPWFLPYLLWFLALALLILFHELIHGFSMKMFTTAKIKYGFAFAYAYAGCSAYFNRRQYIVIALAPVVLLGVFLLALTFLLPQNWFWTIHIFQVINISSAAGDIFMVNYIRKRPANVLVLDDGPAMSIYERRPPTKEDINVQSTVT